MMEKYIYICNDSVTTCSLAVDAARLFTIGLGEKYTAIRIGQTFIVVKGDYKPEDIEVLK